MSVKQRQILALKRRSKKVELGRSLTISDLKTISEELGGRGCVCLLKNLCVFLGCPSVVARCHGISTYGNKNNNNRLILIMNRIPIDLKAAGFYL